MPAHPRTCNPPEGVLTLPSLPPPQSWGDGSAGGWGRYVCSIVRMVTLLWHNPAQTEERNLVGVIIVGCRDPSGCNVGIAWRVGLEEDARGC